MSSIYERFRTDKKKIKQSVAEQFSERTLSFYEQITEALGREEYADNHKYLQSILEYIEKEEFITERQIEIVEKILNHPDLSMLPPDEVMNYSPF